MKTLTKPQHVLMLALSGGGRIEYIDQNYTLVRKGEPNENFWPSTFYGLYDNQLVEPDYGGYIISKKGLEVLHGKET